MGMRLIHVGIGGRGTGWVKWVRQREDFECVAVVDIDADRLAAAKEVSGLPESACYSSMDEALAGADADAVVVTTPPQIHGEQCLAAVQAGKHVLVEKPFTKSLAEARRVIEEADARGVKVAATQNARYSALHATINRLVREGAYGKPLFGLMTKFGWRPRVHHSGQDRHAYLWERGIHDLDTMRCFFNAEPVRVWGHSFNPPWSPYMHGAGTHAWVAFEGGATCGYLCTFAAHKAGSCLRIDLEGGTLEVVGDDLLLRRPGESEDEVVALDEVPRPEAVLLDGFGRYVSEGVEPEFGGHENLTTVGLVEAVGVSSDEGRIVDFREFLQGGA